MQSLVYYLNQNGFYSTAVNNIYFDIDGAEIKSNKLLFRIFQILSKAPKIRGLLNKCKNHFFINLSKYYDIIDLHYLSELFYDIIESKKRVGKLVVTYWGSDFLRASSNKLNKQKQLISKIDLFRTNNIEIKNRLEKEFNINRKKIAYNRFGITKFPLIEYYLKMKEKNNCLYEIPDDKIKICLASNGSESQQHVILINAIFSLPDELKEKIHIIVPFTYWIDKYYIQEIKLMLLKYKYSYTFIDQYISVNDICKLRVMTDIFITIQTTDGFSGAVQEHLFAQNIVLAGNWLPYFILRQRGLKIFDTRIDNLKENISNLLHNIDELKKVVKGNSEIMHNQSSWEYLIAGWIKSYKNCMSGDKNI